MSTRQERREWQEFREKHGIKTTYNKAQIRKNFIDRWTQMFGKRPADKDIDDFMAQVDDLRKNLGRRKTDQKRRKTDRAPVVITRVYEWDMAHRLPNHEGKCRRLHGHRYVAEIDIMGQLQTSGSAQGMVMDFADLDKHVDEAIGYWDHRCMLFDGDRMIVEMLSDANPTEDVNLPAWSESFGIFYVPFHPTAENIAREILARLQGTLPAGVLIYRVRLYETPNGWAEVRP